MNVIVNIGQAALPGAVQQAATFVGCSGLGDLISSTDYALINSSSLPIDPGHSSVYLGMFGGIQPYLEAWGGGLIKFLLRLGRRSEKPSEPAYDPQNILAIIKEIDARLADPSADEDEDILLLDKAIIDSITKKAEKMPGEKILLAKLAGLQRIKSVWPLRVQVAAVQVVGKTASVIQLIKGQPSIKKVAVFGLETTREDIQEAAKAGIKLTVATAGLGDSRQDLFVISRMERGQIPFVQQYSKIGTLLVADLRIGQELNTIISDLNAAGWFAEVVVISDMAFVVAVKNSMQMPAETAVPRPHRTRTDPERPAATTASRFSSSTSIAAVTTGRNVVLGLAAKCRDAGVDLSSLPVSHNRNTWTGVYTLEALADDVFANVGRYIAHAEILGIAAKTGGEISSRNMHELKLLADAFLSIVVAYEFAAKKGEKPFLPYAIKMVELFKVSMESKNLAAIMYAIGKALEEKRRTAKMAKQELQEAVGADLRKIHETIKAILSI